MATNSSVLADALEDEEPTPGGKGDEGGGRHDEISSVTVPSMEIVPPTDGIILANGA